MIEEDTLVIGTSPIMLCQAIRLRRSGRRVTVMDSGHEIGGAWATTSLFGYQDVEQAVHLLENRARTHSILDGEIGIPLAPEIGSFGVLANRRTNLNVARLLSFSGSSVRAFARYDRPRISRGVRSSIQAARNWRVPFLYPPRGSKQILDALRGICEAASISLEFDQTIKRLEIDRDGSTVGVVCSEFDRVFRTVVISSRAHAELRVDGVEVKRDADESLTRSIVLHCDGGGTPDLGYVEVIGDAILRRVRNIGRFTTPTPREENTLLCVQIRERNPKLPRTDPEITAERVVRRLIELAIVPRTCRLLAYETKEYAHSTIPAGRLKSIGRIDRDRLLVVESTDFSEGLAAPLSESSTALNP